MSFRMRLLYEHSALMLDRAKSGMLAALLREFCCCYPATMADSRTNRLQNFSLKIFWEQGERK